MIRRNRALSRPPARRAGGAVTVGEAKRPENKACGPIWHTLKWLAGRLAADLVVLGSAPESLGLLLASQTEATADEREIARDGFDLITTVRDLAKARDGISAGLRKKLGVGTKVDPRDTDAVKTRLRVIAELNDAQARALGVLPAEIDEAGTLRKGVGGADTLQRDRMRGRKGGTGGKNAAQRRVERARKEIAAIGAIHFRKNSTVRAKFEALAQGRPRPRPLKRPSPPAGG